MIPPIEHTVKPARRELKLAHRRAHQGGAGVFQLEEVAHVGGPHIGVAGQTGVEGAQALFLARRFDAGAHLIGSLAQPLIGKFVLSDARNVDGLRVSIRSSGGPEMHFW